MPEKTSISTHTSNMIRNIITGVLTTVAGACAVYFLGFHNNSGSNGDYLVTKEATTKAWKSYVTIENVYYKNQVSLLNDLQRTKNLDDFKEGLSNESRKFQNDLQILIKDNDIDKAFISMIDRRLDNEKSIGPKLDKYIDNIKAISNSSLSPEEKQQKLLAEDADWTNSNKGITERAINDIEDIAKTLSERYGQPFAMTDFLVYQYIKNNANKTDSITNQTNQNNYNNTTNNTNPNNNNSNINTDNNINNGNNNPGNNGNGNGNINNNNSNNFNTNRSNYEAKDFAGKWNTPGAFITLSSNGNMEWLMTNGVRTLGTWRFYNNQISMTYPNQNGVVGTYTFNLYNITANSFTMQLVTYPNYTYLLTRSSGNY